MSQHFRVYNVNAQWMNQGSIQFEKTTGTAVAAASCLFKHQRPQCVLQDVGDVFLLVIIIVIFIMPSFNVGFKSSFDMPSEVIWAQRNILAICFWLWRHPYPMLSLLRLFLLPFVVSSLLFFILWSPKLRRWINNVPASTLIYFWKRRIFIEFRISIYIQPDVDPFLQVLCMVTITLKIHLAKKTRTPICSATLPLILFEKCRDIVATAIPAWFHAFLELPIP